jgi:peptidoglycan/LPS O-acetylase OafA/YrhL
MTSPTRTGTTRLAALDGLRGIACLVVLLHHCMLSIPVFADAYFNGAHARATQTLDEYLLTWTPLHLLWEGTGAVWAFFVLSGFVLTRQVLVSPRFTWRSYYPQRIIRLYIPVLAAVLLAAALVTIFGNAQQDAAPSDWIARRADSMNPSGLLHDATLLFGAGAGISPLWSLQWEVWFSLLLPLFVFAVRARRGATGRLALAIVPAAVFAVFALGGGEYLVVFLVGAVLASLHDRLGSLTSAVAARPRVAGGLIACAVAWVVVILPARWTLWFWRLPGTVTMVLSVSAAAVTVLLVLYWPAVQRALTWRPVLWAGAVSFSLYLVHEPILVSSVRAFGDRHLWLSLPLAAAVALGVAELFRRFVEAPSATLARHAGRTIADWRPAPAWASTPDAVRPSTHELWRVSAGVGNR